MAEEKLVRKEIRCPEWGYGKVSHEDYQLLHRSLHQHRSSRN